MKGDEAGHARASPDPRRRREGPRDARCASVLGEGTARGAAWAEAAVLHSGAARKLSRGGGWRKPNCGKVVLAAHTDGPADRRLTPRGPQGPLGALAGAGGRRWQPGAGMEGSVGT